MANWLKNTVVLMIVFSMLSSFTAFAAYNPPDSPDASYYIASYSVSLKNAGNGNIKVSFDITGTSVMSSLGASAIKIYKSNGTHVASIYYFQSGRTGMMGSNKIYHSDTELINVGAGSYYAIITFYAGNSSGSDSQNVQTSTKTITNP